MSSNNQSNNNNSIQINGPKTTSTFHYDFSNEPIMTIYNDKDLIVKLNRDGTVDWTNGCNDAQMEEAVDAFCNALIFGGAKADGLAESVRKKLVANVFERMIEIAETHGPLSAEDLRTEQQCYKMISRLKGTE